MRFIIGVVFAFQVFHSSTSQADSVKLIPGQSHTVGGDTVSCHNAPKPVQRMVRCRFNGHLTAHSNYAAMDITAEGSGRGLAAALSEACSFCAKRTAWSRQTSCHLETCFDSVTGDEIPVTDSNLRVLPTVCSKR